jgi:hypothetical protein
MDQTQTYAENQTVVGYFNDQDRAERALDELRDAGFTSAHLGVAHRGFSSTGSTTSKKKHAAEGMWDKVKNFFEGGSAEPYADERTRGDMSTREVTDPSAAYDSSYSYSNDDIHHSLTGMSVPEYRSRYFSHKFGTNQKGAIVTVNAGERFADAERILRETTEPISATRQARPPTIRRITQPPEYRTATSPTPIAGTTPTSPGAPKMSKTSRYLAKFFACTGSA